MLMFVGLEPTPMTAPISTDSTRAVRRPFAHAELDVSVRVFITRRHGVAPEASCEMLNCSPTTVRKVDIYQMPEHTLVGEFNLKKTFAWGGIYGAATSMEGIEDTFADGVAATVTGQEEASKQKT